MHEISIVLSIIDIAEQQAALNGARHVEEIELEIGQLAGVEWDALDFAWEAATKNTVLEKSSRKLTIVDGRARCLECGQAFSAPTLFTECPSCGSFFSDLLSGKELRVKSLTLV
ncbi:MAG: hydrogenase maturation nickel metallochaperone HypA [Haliscomenobacter sp.]|nr:hydrogenase maturation nickel metallochaperone HypA [Haliscomenobacter sp.]